MVKIFATFGTSHLKEIKDKLSPAHTMVIVEAEDEVAARQIIFDSFIGVNFSTTYPIERKEEFEKDCNMKAYTLEELEDMLNIPMRNVTIRFEEDDCLILANTNIPMEEFNDAYCTDYEGENYDVEEKFVRYAKDNKYTFHKIEIEETITI